MHIVYISIKMVVSYHTDFYNFSFLSGIYFESSFKIAAFFGM